MENQHSLLPRNPMHWRGENYPPGHPLAGSDLLKTGTCPHWEKIKAGLVLIGQDPDVWQKQDQYCGTNWRMMSAESDGSEGPFCACVRVVKELAIRVELAEIADKAPIAVKEDGTVEETIKCQLEDLSAEAYAICRRVDGTKLLKQWQDTLTASGKKKATLQTACMHAKRVLKALMSGPLGTKDRAEWVPIFISGVPTCEGCQLAPKDRPRSVIHY